MNYTVGTGFSGIGVPDLVARLLEMDTLWQIEKDAFCQKVLRKNFPEVPNLYGDIFDAHPCYVDIAVFGFPCQPFSGAGKQLGERDPRYLVPEMLRVIDECKPRVVVLENVPGFTSLNDGKSFKGLLRTLAKMGFDAEWGHIRASDVGAPHTRERWWLVAYANSQRRSEPQAGDAALHEQWQRAAYQRRGETEFHAFIAGGSPLAYADSCGRRQGRNHRGKRYLLRNVYRNAPQDQPKRQEWQRWLGSSDAAPELGDTHRTGRREQRAAVAVQPQFFAAQCTGRGNGTETQPRMGRVIDGTADWLDGYRPYPSRPGELQAEWEPRRVTGDTENRAARLKALGNSMVVDVLFEVMSSILTWLKTQDGVLT